MHIEKSINQSVKQSIISETFPFFTGPAYWGRLNTEWRLCNDGKLQSPIDIDPKHLLFDPTLKKLSTEGYQV